MGSRKEKIGHHCPYCGAVVVSGEYFCRSSHRKFTDQNELNAPLTHQADMYVVAVWRRRSRDSSPPSGSQAVIP
ncbi:MAG: hypothetical protein M0R30_09270 [Methanoregula sp.]|uniref:hypothetical protein n=1 Tax=Methanoregula sp. TaxID=2052170 RepID=UPI0025F1B5AE|nr:hypothetical protein [Methanoregula sp.]MCK9631820.1 hypothetical protein [Methanoregula sp.]